MLSLPDLLLNIIFPKRCVSCGMFGRYICKSCEQNIDYIEFPFCAVCKSPAIGGITHPSCHTPFGMDGLYVLGHYKGPLKLAIKHLKYRLVRDIVDELTTLLADKSNHLLRDIDLITSVPLHVKRKKMRGFNQAELLGESLAKKMHVPFYSNILLRTKFGVPQVELKGSERRLNMRNMFSCLNKSQIEDKRIGLVDDVSTTGTTLLECTKVLKRNGAKKVWGIVLAHGN